MNVNCKKAGIFKESKVIKGVTLYRVTLDKTKSKFLSRKDAQLLLKQKLALRAKKKNLNLAHFCRYYYLKNPSAFDTENFLLGSGFIRLPERMTVKIRAFWKINCLDIASVDGTSGGYSCTWYYVLPADWELYQKKRSSFISSAGKLAAQKAAETREERKSRVDQFIWDALSKYKYKVQHLSKSDCTFEDFKYYSSIYVNRVPERKTDYRYYDLRISDHKLSQGFGVCFADRYDRDGGAADEIIVDDLESLTFEERKELVRALVV